VPGPLPHLLVSYSVNRSGATVVAMSPRASRTSSMQAMCFATDVGLMRYLSPKGVSAAAIEVALGAVSLNAPSGAEMAGVLGAQRSLIECEGKFAVGTGRRLAQRVVVHWINDTAARRTSRSA
jgi:hypothetical protein